MDGGSDDDANLAEVREILRRGGDNAHASMAEVREILRRSGILFQGVGEGPEAMDLDEELGADSSEEEGEGDDGGEWGLEEAYLQMAEEVIWGAEDEGGGEPTDEEGEAMDDQDELDADLEDMDGLD